MNEPAITVESRAVALAAMAAEELDILVIGGRRKGLAFSRHLSRTAALKEFAGLTPTALVEAIRYSDAQVDDARHTVTVVRSAVAQGAFATSRTRVSGITREGVVVTGATLIDQETGESYSVRASIGGAHRYGYRLEAGPRVPICERTRHRLPSRTHEHRVGLVADLRRHLGRLCRAPPTRFRGERSDQQPLSRAPHQRTA